jgi:hypothetical protein
MRTLSRRAPWAPLLASLVLAAVLPAAAGAYTPSSPEVVQMVDKALKYLETASDPRLGGKCLIGLAYFKAGKHPSDPRIAQAVEACHASLADERETSYIYSKALAVIFLTELNAEAHRDLILAYAEMLKPHQKPHGGFGYTTSLTGDTSQTQYTALAYWELLNHGHSPDAGEVQRCLKWLLRTQDPTGTWGYQGDDPGDNTYTLRAQQDHPGLSMGAAGMSSVLILGNAIGYLTPQSSPVSPLDGGEAAELPAALKRVETAPTTGRVPTLSGGDVPRQQLGKCLELARGWWAKNFSLDVPDFPLYYLYSLERLKSFEGYLTGGEEPEPSWYDAGVQYLLKNQAADGHWTDPGCGDACGTAFGVLFLLRSTQQSIKATLGEGTLVGGRGLPRDLSKVRLQGGRLVVQQNPTELDQLLEMMEGGENADLDALVGNPAALEVTEVTPEAARRLQQIVRSGSPESRLLAVRALSRARQLDYAPTLIYALTDPDNQVVREARDGLRRVSRNFEGLGPPDNFDDQQRRQAITAWKKWYATVRPDAPPLP